MIWLFKLTVTPLLIAAATLVTRRFGPHVGGLLVGLPIMAGPISLFFAIEQGHAFATQAAIGTLLALMGVAAWSAVYGLLAPRLSWPVALLVATTAFLAVSAAASQLRVGLIAAGLGAYGTLGVAMALLRPPSTMPTLGQTPWWDIWLRMGISAVMVAAITFIAGGLGPTWSGIIGAFPVITTVAICFMHQQWGPAAVAVGLRGIVLSLISFVSFFIAVGLALPRTGIGPAYLIATASAVLTSMCVLAILRVSRRTHPADGASRNR